MFSQYLKVLRSSLCSNEHSCRFLNTSVMSAPCSVVFLSFLCFKSYFCLKHESKKCFDVLWQKSVVRLWYVWLPQDTVVWSMSGLYFYFAANWGTRQNCASKHSLAQSLWFDWKCEWVGKTSLVADEFLFQSRVIITRCLLCLTPRQPEQYRATWKNWWRVWRNMMSARKAQRGALIQSMSFTGST